MNKIKTYTLRIDGDSPEQTHYLTTNGTKLMMKKIMAENRFIQKYTLTFHFNKRDVAITDDIKKCYLGLIDTFEEVVGWEAQEVILTASTSEESDMKTTYTIDIIFHLD